MSPVQHQRFFIGGQWVAPSGRGKASVINPVSEEPIASVPMADEADVDAAARAAAAAFDGWSRSPVAQRVEFFERLARLTRERADELTRTIVSELGQPAKVAALTQVAGAVDELEVIAASLSEIAWTVPLGRTLVRREATGVVGAITPWNSPLRAVIVKAGAAIAAGCTVVLKASEVAPLSAFIFAEMAEQAGLPPGVLNLIVGTGPQAGEALVRHPAVESLSLTGSLRAGRRVMELASQWVKPVHLELGGKSANLILEDADFERAIVDGIDDALRNSGQVCGGLTRMLVPRHRLDEAVALAAAKANSYVLGDPFDERTTLGPVATAAQRDRIQGYIRGGMADGVRLHAGGPEAPEGLSRGWFVRPTIFSGDNHSRVAREEIFGPVVVLIPFDDEAQAVAIANDSPYGLAAGVWCGDVERARGIAQRLRVGRVRINGCPLDKRAPHGGFKLSGIGREWGRFGIEAFLDYKSVIG